MAVEEIRSALALLFEPGQIVELRCLNTNKGTRSGYFDNMDRLAQVAESLSGHVPAVYVTLNPVHPDLLARANNRVREYARETTTDDQILRRCWLPIDLDPVRPSGISATAAEKDAALARAIDVREHLRSLDWPEPIFADSGNGGHLLVRLDLPNDAVSRELVSGCLQSLAARFDDDLVKVDQGTYNAARIWKLYGTLACKGDNVPDRPHRLAQLLEWQAL